MGERRKLIEVSLPLDVINQQSARKNPSSTAIRPPRSKRLIRNELLITGWLPLLLKMQLDKYLWKNVPHIEIQKLWTYLSSYCYLPRLKNERVRPRFTTPDCW